MFVITITPLAHDIESKVGDILQNNNSFCLDSMEEFKQTWEMLKFSRDEKRGCILAYGSEKDMLSFFEAMCTDEDWQPGVWTV